ncbi:MAG: CapA family protein [Candidatus Moraniibacteriota bacterium]
MSGKLLAIFIISIALFGGCERSQPVEQKPVAQDYSQKVLPKRLELKVPSDNTALMPFSSGYSNVNRNDNGDNNYFIPNIQKNKPIEILFTGDLMFDRYIRQVATKKGNDYIFSGVKNLLTGSDLVVANLEGPLTDYKSVSVNTKVDEKNNLIFTFDPSLATTLAELNIKLVNIGNNHILNFSPAGAEQTKAYLLAAGVNFFGDTGATEKKYWVKEINGRKIGFVNYNFSVKGSTQNALGDIQLAKQEADLVVVCPHWGTEYKTGGPGAAVRSLAHQFVDTGADLVIGTHPHVIQSSEVYQGKKIYYSLGNFIFDQYFSQETQKGLAVRVKINPPDLKMEVEEVLLTLLKNGQTQPAK